eukprot:3428799-Lingulodinium_polyedra.AAC.1
MQPRTLRGAPCPGVCGNASRPCSSVSCPFSSPNKPERAVVGLARMAPLRSMLPGPPNATSPLLAPAGRG